MFVVLSSLSSGTLVMLLSCSKPHETLKLKSLFISANTIWYKALTVPGSSLNAELSSNKHSFYCKENRIFKAERDIFNIIFSTIDTSFDV